MLTIKTKIKWSKDIFGNQQKSPIFEPEHPSTDVVLKDQVFGQEKQVTTQKNRKA